MISAIIASIWNVFIKFRWHDEKLILVARAEKKISMRIQREFDPILHFASRYGVNKINIHSTFISLSPSIHFLKEMHKLDNFSLLDNALWALLKGMQLCKDVQISSRVENSRTLARKYVNLMIDTYVNICIWGLLSVIKSARVEENNALKLFS